MLFVPVYPNLVLIDCYWYEYVISRELFGFFEDNKFSYTLAFIGVIIMMLYIKIIELKGEREVKDFRIL